MGIIPNRIRLDGNRDTLQRAVERSQPGDILELPNDAVYGPLQLPPRHLDGVVVTAADPTAQQKPTIASDSRQVWPVQSDWGSGGIKFVGLLIQNQRTDSTDNPSGVVALGQNAGHISAPSNLQLTRDVEFDQCEISGLPDSSNTMHGIIGNAINLMISRCKIRDIVHGDAESHGIYLDDTPGPVYVVQNSITASGINILCGGGSPVVPNQRVCVNGLVIRNNYLDKKLIWYATKKTVGCKNLLELKNCWLARIIGNTLANSWADNQDGSAVLFTPREHNPAMYGKEPRPAPNTKLGDILFAQNTMVNVSGAFNISGSDDLGTVSQTESIRIWGNNVAGIGSFDNPTGRAFNLNGVDATKPIRELDVRWNRFAFATNAGKSLITFQGVPCAVDKLTFEENDYGATRYGIFATGGKQGAAALDQFCRSGSFRFNLCSDGSDPNVCESWQFGNNRKAGDICLQRMEF